MMEEKLRHLYYFYEEIYKLLMTTDGLEDDMIPIVRITSLASYFRHSGTITTVKQEDSEHFMKLIASMVCKSSSKFVINEQKHLVSQCCGEIRLLASTLYDDFHSSDVSDLTDFPKYKSHWQAHEIIVQENMHIPANIEKESSLGDDNEHLGRVWALVDNLIALFRLKEFVNMCSEEGRDCLVDIPPWIFMDLEVEDGEVNGQSQPALNSKCCGGSGKRRVISIISACLYSWLQERCMEWHADLTQKELLSDAIDDEFMKNVKKKASKKKKKALSGNHTYDKTEQRDESQSPVHAFSEEKIVGGEAPSKIENRESHKDDYAEPRGTRTSLHLSADHNYENIFLESNSNDGLREEESASQPRPQFQIPFDESGKCIEKIGDYTGERMSLRSDKPTTQGYTQNPDPLDEGAGEPKPKASTEGNINESNDDGFVTIGGLNQSSMASKKTSKKKKDVIKPKRDAIQHTTQGQNFAQSTDVLLVQRKATSTSNMRPKNETVPKSKGKRNNPHERQTRNNPHERQTRNDRLKKGTESNTERVIEAVSEKAVDGAQERRQPKQKESTKVDLKNGKARKLSENLSNDSDSRLKATKGSNRTHSTSRDVNNARTRVPKQSHRAKRDDKDGEILDVNLSQKASRVDQKNKKQRKSKASGRRGLKKNAKNETQPREDIPSERNTSIEDNVNLLEESDDRKSQSNANPMIKSNERGNQNDEEIDEVTRTRTNDLEETDIHVLDGDINVPCQTFLHGRLVDVLIEGNYTHLPRSNLN